MWSLPWLLSPIMKWSRIKRAEASAGQCWRCKSCRGSMQECVQITTYSSQPVSLVKQSQFPHEGLIRCEVNAVITLLWQVQRSDAAGDFHCQGPQLCRVTRFHHRRAWSDRRPVVLHVQPLSQGGILGITGLVRSVRRWLSICFRTASPIVFNRKYLLRA